MKITRAQIQKLIHEEVETLDYKLKTGKTDIIIDHDHPSDVEAKEDSWAGGQNIHSQEEHQLKMGTKEKSVRGYQRLKIAEEKLTRRKLRGMIARLLGEATIDHRMQEADDDALNLLCHVLVAGCETIFGEDLSEEDEYEYGRDFWSVLSKHPDVAAKLNEIAMEIRMGSHDSERMNTAPVPSREEVLEVVVKLFREAGSGELSEQDFLSAMDDVRDDYDLVSPEDLDAMNITHDEVLLLVGDIENFGMPTDRP